jgi:hypothetical protein
MLANTLLDDEAQEVLRVFYLARQKKADDLLLVTTSVVPPSTPEQQNLPVVDHVTLQVTPMAAITLEGQVQITPIGTPKEKLVLTDKQQKKFERDLFDYNRIVTDNRLKSAIFSGKQLKDVASVLEDIQRTVLKVDANGSFLNFIRFVLLFIMSLIII